MNFFRSVLYFFIMAAAGYPAIARAIAIDFDSFFGPGAEISTISRSSGPASVTIPYRSTWSMDQYLVYFLRKIPLDQLRVSPDSPKIQVGGFLTFDFKDFPEDQKLKLQGALDEVFAGRRSISGVFIDASEAEIFYEKPKWEIKPLPLKIEPLRAGDSLLGPSEVVTEFQYRGLPDVEKKRLTELLYKILAPHDEKTSSTVPQFILTLNPFEEGAEMTRDCQDRLLGELGKGRYSIE